MNDDVLVKILLAGMTVLAGVVAALWRRDALRSDKCETRVSALEAALAETQKEVRSLQDQRVREAKEMLMEGLRAIDRNSDRLESNEKAFELLRQASEAALARLSRP